MKDNNYLRSLKAGQSRASKKGPRFQSRTPERGLVWAGSVYMIVMAGFLMLGALGVIPTANGEEIGGGKVAYVVLYSIVSIAVAAFASFVAFRWIKPGHPERKVMWSLIGVVAFTVITFDTVALLVFGLALGFYLVKDRVRR